MIEVKYFLEKDWAAWKEIRLEALRVQPDSFGSSYEEEALYQEHDWQKFINENVILGAFLNGELVGCGGFFVFKFLKMKHKGVMFGLYVKPKARNKGVASKIIRMIINHAKNSVTLLYCSVVTTNQAALKLYQKYGFKIYGTELKALKIENVYFDEYQLALEMTKFNEKL